MNKLGAIIQFFRKLKYRLLSTSSGVKGSLVKHQPVQINGAGEVRFGTNVQIGVFNSPSFYNTYAYIEARQQNAQITFGNNVAINNNFCAVANESSISIGDETVIGANCQIYNCNFHNLDPLLRTSNPGKSAPVSIGKNVFIGTNVIILKGVTIGDNAVIGAGSIVKENVPANTTYSN